MNGQARMVTPRFVVVVSSGFFYFLALAMLTPVLSLYVKHRLGYDELAVGVVAGAFSVGAVSLRTYAGRLGDTAGRRVLIVFGALIVAVSTVLYGVVHALWWLIAMRVVTGFGEAGFFVGAATMITDLAPAERRGEAVSYWSVAVYGGLALGPAFGDFLSGHHGFTIAFVASGGMALLACAFALFTKDVPREHDGNDRHDGTDRPRLWHPAAVRPGVVLFLGLLPLAAFAPLIPLYLDKSVHASTGAIFLLYGVLILVVRIVGARLPDRMGARNAGALALAFAGVGVGIIAAWASLPGLILGTVIFASGMSLMYPALLLLAISDIRDSERASVVGTFSSFFDLSQGFGAAIAGTIAHFAGIRGAFAVAGAASVLGVLLLRASVAPAAALTS